MAKLPREPKDPGYLATGLRKDGNPWSWLRKKDNYDAKTKGKRRYTAEQREAKNQKLREKRAQDIVAGLCTRCHIRDAVQDPLNSRTVTTCVACREAVYKDRTDEPDFSKPVDFCVECAGANFHRDDCPNMVSTVSVDTRIHLMIQGVWPRKPGPLSLDKADPSALEAQRPDSVEDGRSRDEGLPESGLEETPFPVPAGVILIPPYPASREL